MVVDETAKGCGTARWGIAASRAAKRGSTSGGARVLGGFTLPILSERDPRRDPTSGAPRRTLYVLGPRWPPR